MDQIGQGEEEMVSDHHKSCVDCKTTKTPLWRSGPSGPKSLCNACGIRYRKKRAVTTTRDSKKCLPEKKESSAEEEDENGIGKETSYKKRKVSEELRSRVMALGKEVVALQQQQQPRSPVRRRRRKSNDHYWRKMGEVEQAAVLLMALFFSSKNIERER